MKQGRKQEENKEENKKKTIPFYYPILSSFKF